LALIRKPTDSQRFCVKARIKKVLVNLKIWGNLTIRADRETAASSEATEKEDA
jgi:hypothetical protein